MRSSVNIDISNSKYLTDYVLENGVSFEGNSLIIAPVGSGKTHFILEYLAKQETEEVVREELESREEFEEDKDSESEQEDRKRAKLLLVSNTFLKEAMKEEDKVFATGDIRYFGSEDIHIMTYAEFGERVLYTNEFLEDYGDIYCDEIHSLFEYIEYRGNTRAQLISAVKVLFAKHKDRDIYYFTATEEALLNYREKKFKGLYKNLRVYDFSIKKEVKRYMEKHDEYFNNSKNIIHCYNGLEKYEKEGLTRGRGVIFTRTISGMESIAEDFEREGYKVLCLWSINNEERDMTEKQIRDRDYLLKEKKIPKEYDFLIINSAMREGWDLEDDTIETVIVNSTNMTDVIQARGRVRKDINFFLTKNNDLTDLEGMVLKRAEIFLREGELVRENLTSNDKRDLAENMRVFATNGRLIRWNSIRVVLEKSGYKIKDKIERKNGKRRRVSKIYPKNTVQ